MVIYMTRITTNMIISSNGETQSKKLNFSEMKKIMNHLNDETMEILNVIQTHSPQTLKELAKLTGRKASNLSRTLKILTEHQLIKISEQSYEVGFQQLDLQFDIETDSKPRVVSLFSGCGGLDLGFQRAGYEIVFANDIENSVKQTYETNLKHKILIQDIRTVNKETDIPEHIDIVLAGIPCQPFSTSGNRGAMNDDRGRLFQEVMEVVDVKKPKIVLFENVRGFLSAKDDSGKPMPERIRSELAEHGYTLTYRLVNSADYGVPQNRYRVLLVGVRNDLVETKGKFCFPDPVERKKSQTVGAVIKDSHVDGEEFEVWPLSPQAIALCEHIPAGGSWKSVPIEYLPERLKKIRANMSKYHSPNFYRRFNLDEIMGTVTAAATPENSGILHPLENRRYSVREIARFQSFPDDFKFIGCPVSKKYKMIGNAVPPTLAFHIARALKTQFF